MKEIEIKDNPSNTQEVETNKTEKKRIISWKEDKILIILMSISFITILGALSFLYFFVYKSPVPTHEVLNLKGEYVEANKISEGYLGISLSSPAIPKTEESPLNGELFTKKEMAKMLQRRPVSVMINNHTEARPQSGLVKADIIYEAVTESGITRYMAIFWSEGAAKVGPVRSARQYYLEWLSPFDSIYIHDGCASTTDPRTNACGNIVTYGIKDIRTLGYWRVTDRVAPHNEYNSILTAWDYGKQYNWDSFPTKTESLLFKKDASYDERGDRTKVKVRFREDITYNGALYDSEWSYNKDTNLYYHKIGGQKDIDLETKQQVTAKTVVFEEVALQTANDGKGRVIITTIGQGKVVILIDGKVIKGTWKKTSRTDRTRYYDSNNKEIAINRGLLWITAVPKDQGKFDIIEQ